MRFRTAFLEPAIYFPHWLTRYASKSQSLAALIRLLDQLFQLFVGLGCSEGYIGEDYTAKLTLEKITLNILYQLTTISKNDGMSKFRLSTMYM